MSTSMRSYIAFYADLSGRNSMALMLTALNSEILVFATPTTSIRTVPRLRRETPMCFLRADTLSLLKLDVTNLGGSR